MLLQNYNKFTVEQSLIRAIQLNDQSMIHNILQTNSAEISINSWQTALKFATYRRDHNLLDRLFQTIKNPALLNLTDLHLYAKELADTYPEILDYNNIKNVWETLANQYRPTLPQRVANQPQKRDRDEDEEDHVDNEERKKVKLDSH